MLRCWQSNCAESESRQDDEGEAYKLSLKMEIAKKKRKNQRVNTNQKIAVAVVSFANNNSNTQHLADPAFAAMTESRARRGLGGTFGSETQVIVNLWAQKRGLGSRGGSTSTPMMTKAGAKWSAKLC